jgi:NAD(P)-dependent dehydrogenase (short-subunit alcohol dehydrogenase family)
LTELRFDDRVIIVTGAGRGIGRCHALLLAARGAHVVVADNGAGIDGAGSSRAPADEVVREITDAGGEAVACHASVASEEDAAEIVNTALQAYGRLDAVVNNAGISDPGPFESLSVDQFRRMLDVHFFGTLFVTKAAWPHMVQAGYGRIVNTVSEAMLGGLAELTSYGAAKGAVFGLTRNLATEGSAHGIRVNAVAPRAYTRMSAEQSGKVAAQMSFSDELMAEINASMPPDLCAPAAAYPRARILFPEWGDPASRHGQRRAHRRSGQQRYLRADGQSRGHRRPSRPDHGRAGGARIRCCGGATLRWSARCVT